MFIGEYQHTLDSKNRLALPSKFRKNFKGKAVITRGLDSCLFVYPVKEWQMIAEKLGSMPVGEKFTRSFVRLMLAGAVDVEIDSQGRVLPLKTQMLFKRLRALQDIDPYTRQTALRHKALRILNKVVNLLNIDQRIRDQAIDKYKTFTKKEGFSRNNILIIAACLLIASREVKGVKPLTLNEICEGFKLVGHDIHPRVLSKTVFKVLNVIGAKPTIMSPEDYVDKVIDKLCSSKEIMNRIQVNRLTVHEYFSELREEAKKLLCSLNERRKMGKNPYALAVSSIYAASLITSSKRELQISILTQKLLSEIADVAEYTIREHYYTLFKDEVEKLISATSPM